MNKHDPYQSWLEQKRRHEPAPELVDQVMDRVAAHAQARREPGITSQLLPRLLEWVSLRPLAQAAMMAGGVVLAALRLLATLQFLLSY